jgi:phosphate:Na+ symporter
MQRLHERCEEDEDRAVTARQAEGLQEPSALLAGAISDVTECFGEKRWRRGAEIAAAAAEKIKVVVKPYRQAAMAAAAGGEAGLAVTTRKLEAVRWLRRVSRHVNRIASHLAEIYVEEPPPGSQQ